MDHGICGGGVYSIRLDRTMIPLPKMSVAFLFTPDAASPTRSVR